MLVDEALNKFSLMFSVSSTMGMSFFKGFLSRQKNDPNFMPWKPDRDPPPGKLQAAYPMFLQKETRLFQQINLRQVTTSNDLFLKICSPQFLASTNQRISRSINKFNVTTVANHSFNRSRSCALLTYSTCHKRVGPTNRDT